MKLFYLAILLLGFAVGIISCDQKKKTTYCTYIAGGDCKCYRPPIASTDVICIPCDSTQTDCPNVVRLIIYCPPRDGRRDTCTITATRRSRECMDCPSNGKKLNPGDYRTVVLGN